VALALAAGGEDNVTVVVVDPLPGAVPVATEPSAAKAASLTTPAEPTPEDCD